MCLSDTPDQEIKRMRIPGTEGHIQKKNSIKVLIFLHSTQNVAVFVYIEEILVFSITSIMTFTEAENKDSSDHDYLIIKYLL